MLFDSSFEAVIRDWFNCKIIKFVTVWVVQRHFSCEKEAYPGPHGDDPSAPGKENRTVGRAVGVTRRAVAC